MVSVTLPPYIVLPPKPFVDPMTGFPRPPAFRSSGTQGTILQWNVSALRVNETWSVRFVISSSRLGVVDTLSLPASRASYLRWDGRSVFMPFPRVPVTVIQSSEPKVRYTITRSPEVGLVRVDGSSYAVPAVFDWDPNSDHEVEAIGADAFGPDSRYLFSAWDDGGAMDHGIHTGSTNVTIKIPQLRNEYQKTGFNCARPTNNAGFGVLHDGSVDSLERFVAEVKPLVANT